MSPSILFLTLHVLNYVLTVQSPAPQWTQRQRVGAPRFYNVAVWRSPQQDSIPLPLASFAQKVAFFGSLCAPQSGERGLSLQPRPPIAVTVSALELPKAAKERTPYIPRCCWWWRRRCELVRAVQQVFESPFKIAYHFWTGDGVPASRRLHVVAG